MIRKLVIKRKMIRKSGDQKADDQKSGDQRRMTRNQMKSSAEDMKKMQEELNKQMDKMKEEMKELEKKKIRNWSERKNMENPQEKMEDIKKICRTALRRWIKSKTRKHQIPEECIQQNERHGTVHAKQYATTKRNNTKKMHKDHTPDPRESCKRIHDQEALIKDVKCHDDQYHSLYWPDAAAV